MEIVLTLWAPVCIIFLKFLNCCFFLNPQSISLTVTPIYGKILYYFEDSREDGRNVKHILYFGAVSSPKNW